MAYLGEDVPKLGFGLMRLPHINNDINKEIDIEQVKEMVDLFIENGFSYFDTAYGYVGSEDATKKALVDRYPRESFYLASKMPSWEAKNRKEAEQMLEISLERTGAGYFDFYLLHNVGGSRTEFFEKYGTWEFLQKKKEEGLIRHVGFSFHDHADLLDEVLTKHPETEFVQLQINYADWNSPQIQSALCYEVARKHNVPIIIMEPLKGGSLCNLPEPVEKIFKKSDPNANLASWGLRFANNLDGIITILSGMSTLEQVRQNIDTFANFKGLTDEDHKTFSNVQQKLEEISSIPCTDCRYCLPGCPMNIPINDTFKNMNNYLIYNNLKSARFSHSFDTRETGKASDCIECGACEEVCTQGIEIIKELKRSAEVLEA